MFIKKAPITLGPFYFTNNKYELSLYFTYLFINRLITITLLRSPYRRLADSKVILMLGILFKHQLN